MRTRSLLLGILVGCGGGGAAPAEAPAPAPPAAEAPAPAAAPEEHAHAMPSAEAPAVAMPAIPEGARVFFVAPKEGEKIVGPLVDGKVMVNVDMGAEKISVVPAGEVVAGTGHHHVIVDGEPIGAGVIVPKDDTHLHFGKAQTTATIPLVPGTHVLQLQMADGLHRSYGPTLAARIMIGVAAAGSVEATAAAAPATNELAVKPAKAPAKPGAEKPAATTKSTPAP